MKIVRYLLLAVFALSMSNSSVLADAILIKVINQSGKVLFVDGLKFMLIKVGSDKQVKMDRQYIKVPKKKTAYLEAAGKNKQLILYQGRKKEQFGRVIAIGGGEIITIDRNGNTTTRWR